MIITKEEYQDYLESKMPAIRYYDIALCQLKEYCPELDETNLNEEELDIVKKAIMLQMAYYYENENIINGISEEITIGKFSKSTNILSNEGISLYNIESLRMLNSVYPY